MEPDEQARTEPRVLLDRYRIERALGRGGMGEVLLAFDTLLDRRVALKRMDPSGADRASRRRRILKEARRASGISDPHIAAVYDAVDLDDEVMLVMEYVDGVTLRRRMTEPVSMDEFWNLATQCVEGIGAAHAHGVIHRDIKPENLMVTPGGRLKILDFGIARQVEVQGDAETVTMPGSESRSYRIAGTPHYMSPEAHFGEDVDARADLFSLGVVFYELLAGARPFEGGTYAAIVNEVLNTTPSPVSTWNPGAGPALSAVVARMLAKKAADRVPSAAALRAMLDSARREPANVAAIERIAGEGVGVEGEPKPHPAGQRAASGRKGEGTLQRQSASARLRRFVGTRVGQLALVLIAALAGVLATRLLSGPALPSTRHLVVLPPELPGASADFSAFAHGAIASLEKRLRRHADTPGFQLAFLSDRSDEDVRSASDARKVLGTNLALLTTLEQTPDLLRAHIELRETRRDHPLARRTVEVPIQQPFTFLDTLYRTSVAMLRMRPLGPPESADVGIRGAGSLRYYLQGVGRLALAKDSTAALAARDDFESACRTEPDAAEARAGLALSLHTLQIRTGNRAWLARADEESRRAVALDTTRAEPFRVRGGVLYALRRTPESLEALRRAEAIRPFDDDLVLRYARAFAHAGEPDSEHQVYLAAEARRPHDWRPHWWLATWYRRAGRMDEAIAQYHEITRRAPEYANGHAWLGGELLVQGRYEEAVRALERSVALRPTADAYSNLGTAQFNRRRFDAAIAAYNQAFQFGEADDRTWMNLGDAYWWSGAHQGEARDAYRRAIDLSREAIAERSRRGASEDVRLFARTATLLARSGSADSARIYLDYSLRAAPDDPDIQYFAALTCWELSDTLRALDLLHHAISSGYPARWARDSPMFDAWRSVAGFQSIVRDSLEDPLHPASPIPGGRS